MTLVRIEEAPVMHLGDVLVAVRDDSGRRIVIRVSEEALEDIDRTNYHAGERIVATEAHWPEIATAAEGKRASNDFEPSGRICMLSADLVPRPTGPTRFV